MKIFRNTRLSNIKTKSVVNYLFYALGEIILVILGILIALYVNNLSEADKNKEKVDILLKDALVDLEDDIKEIDQMIEYYTSKDSIMDLILTDQLTVDNYKKEHQLHFMIATFGEVQINDNSYQLLNQYLDIVPIEYNPLLKKMKHLYTDLRYTIDIMGEEIKEYSSDVFKTWAKERKWFYDLRKGKTTKESFQYFLNDPFYKNEVIVYQTYAVDNYMRSMSSFRSKAIHIYKEIHQQLFQNDQYPEFIPKEEKLSIFDYKKEGIVLAHFVGLFSSHIGMDITISTKDNMLLVQASGQEQFEAHITGKNTVKNAALGLELIFEGSEGQAFDRFLLKQHGQNLYFERESVE